MVYCRIFASKNKDIEPELSDFLKMLPPDYDMKNLKIQSIGRGAAWTHIILIFKVL